MRFWPNLKFFQVIGVMGFGVGVGNSFASWQNRYVTRDLLAKIQEIRDTQGEDVAEKVATVFHNIIKKNSFINCKIVNYNNFKFSII